LFLLYKNRFSFCSWHPEDIDRVLPSLDRETPLKLENSLSISVDWQSGQLMPFSDGDPNTSFSNSDSHFRHLYSKIGMATSNRFSWPDNGITVGSRQSTVGSDWLIGSKLLISWMLIVDY
jgi:hypothetical protein